VHYLPVLYLCCTLSPTRLQTVVVSSASVGWTKQGSCIVVDNEPTPPTLANYEASSGWKQVKSFTVTTDGGDFLFPLDQLLVVTVGDDNSTTYKPIPQDEKRTLAKLSPAKQYLVWYHHLMPDDNRKARFKAAKG
jgi:hypothetical protein